MAHSLIVVNYYLFFANIILLCDRYPVLWNAVGVVALALVAERGVRYVHRHYTHAAMMEMLWACAFVVAIACVVAFLFINIGWIICRVYPENSNPNACEMAPMAYSVNIVALFVAAAPVAKWIAD